MKFDWNKDFSFSQIYTLLKTKLTALYKSVKKVDSNSIKDINIGGKTLRINALRLCSAAAVLAVMLALFINIVVIPHTTYRAYSDLEFDTGGEYAMHPYGRGVLLINNNGFKLVNNKGADIKTLSGTLTNPMVDIAGKYMLLADLDGNNTLNLYDSGGNNIMTYPIDSDILSAKICKRRYAAAAISEEGYKGSVVVYNKHGDEIFKWNSGEGYITDIDISDSGKYIAVAQMMSDRDEVYSKIHILNISKKREISVSECTAQLVTKISFDKHDNIVALGDSKVYGFKKNGAQKYCIDLAGKSPLLCDISNGDNLVFLCRDNRGNSVVEIYSRRGKRLGAYTSDEKINNISIYRDNIIVSTSRNVLSLSRSGKLKKNIAIRHDIMNIGIYGNSRNVLVLGGNKADIVRIR